MNIRHLADESIAEHTTRLLSGSAYRRGILGAFDLLGHLRSDPYKAKSPESTLDFDRVMQHAIQSVTISVTIASVAIALWFLHILFFFLLWDPYEEQVFTSFLLFLVNLAGAALVAYEIVYLRWTIARQFIAQSYNPNFQPNLPLFSEFLQLLNPFFKRQIIQPEPKQNVITFGRYQPFLGAGAQISKWTLAIDRKPPDDQLQNLPRIDIPVEEFYQESDQEIKTLNLPHLEQLSLLFVDGFELEVDGEILTSPKSPPKSILSEEQIWLLGQRRLSDKHRTYRLYRYTDFKRDQVLSYFLRFHNVGAVTFVESSAHILTPIDRWRFSLQPVLKNGKFFQLTKMLGLAFLLLLIPAGYALLALAYVGIFAWTIIAWKLDDRRRLRAVELQEDYNYGHAQTFREFIAANTYQSYYSVQDLTMYWKSIDEAILSSLIRLLKRYGVDTSQFEDAAKAIINTGVMVSGGNFSATQVAAGIGATAIQRRNLRQQAKAVADRITSMSRGK